MAGGGEGSTAERGLDLAGGVGVEAGGSAVLAVAALPVAGQVGDGED